MDDELTRGAQELLEHLKSARLMVATAESCTGGLIAATLTEISGSSAVVDRGFVTYSNQAKAEMLGVPMPLIEAHGAVSEEVARAMADGALDRSQADLAVSVTGIAGPTGGSSEKPVGTVHLALARKGQPTSHLHRQFSGDRAMVRRLTVLCAFDLLSEALSGSGP